MLINALVLVLVSTATVTLVMGDPDVKISIIIVQGSLVIMESASMESILTHVIVQLVSLGTIVRQTLMTVQKLLVPIALRFVTTVSALISVTVLKDSLGISVAPTLMNVNLILALMVELVRIESMAIPAHVKKDSMELTVSNHIKCKIFHICNKYHMIVW